MKTRIKIYTLTTLLAAGLAHGGDLTWLDKMNVTWDSPSKDATGSMPLGGGNLGLNVWVEGDDLLFYIGHPDSRTEDEKLVKLGRVRLSISSSPFRKNFQQELDLAQSCIRIRGDGVAIEMWVDAFEPVIHLEMQADAPVTANIAYESWRFAAMPVTQGLEWSYRLDPKRDSRQAKLKNQNVEALADKVVDPLRNLTLGGRMVGAGLVADGSGEGTYMNTPFKSWKLKTEKPVTKLDLRVLTRVAQDNSIEDWRAALDKLQQAPADRAKTLAWWREFWDRSSIDINPGGSSADQGWQVGRNYQLFRYMLAANRTGKFPTLFNGGIHTFDSPLANANAFGAGGANPDERAWWGCHFMAQNQRLVYWPMLKAGDFDLLDVGLNFYRDRAPIAQAKAKHFLGADGTLFTESLDVFGLTAATPSGNGLEAAGHLTHHFTSALEFAYMMLEEYRFDGRHLQESMPVMLGMLKFYDNFYQQENRKRTGQPLDANGKLVVYPGNSCELGVGCKNHADAMAGLMAITDGLLECPGTDRAWLESFRQRLPGIPLGMTNGRPVIKLAESWESIANPNEFPQMYAVFPFHQYGVGLPDLDRARDTWHAGAPTQKEALCWKYGNIAVADLGLADEARRYALRKFLYPFENDGPTVHYGNCAPFKARFPAFWVTYPFDAFPDMDHGGCAMIGLQEMLLQTPGKRLLLLPAWPKDWNVHFKLHAPQKTTVECVYQNGRIEKLIVTPASRAKDVENWLGKAPAYQPPAPPLSQGKPVTASSQFNQPGYEAANANDGDPKTRWASDFNARSGWLEIDLGSEKMIGSVMLSEIEWPETREFLIEIKQGETYKEIARGTTIGRDKELVLTNPGQARQVRLNVLKSERAININEFQIYPPEKKP
jgi:hypothetical protein